MEHTKNISNKFIAVLIIVALLVTVISTWMILLKIDSIKKAPVVIQQSDDGGHLSFTIESPAEGPERANDGKVSFSIEKI